MTSGSFHKVKSFFTTTPVLYPTMPCVLIPYLSLSENRWYRNGWGKKPEPSSTYLVGDEVLTHGQRHLNSVGFVRDRDGVEFKPVSAVHHACLVHRILKHLLVALLAQHRADVHDFRLAATWSAGAGQKNQDHKNAHGGKTRYPPQIVLYGIRKALGTLFRGGKSRVRGTCSLRRNAHGHWSDVPFASARISYTVRAALLHWSYLYHTEQPFALPSSHWAGFPARSGKMYVISNKINVCCAVWWLRVRCERRCGASDPSCCPRCCWQLAWYAGITGTSFSPTHSFPFHAWMSMDASLQPMAWGWWVWHRLVGYQVLSLPEIFTNSECLCVDDEH